MEYCTLKRSRSWTNKRQSPTNFAFFIVSVTPELHVRYAQLCPRICSSGTFGSILLQRVAKPRMTCWSVELAYRFYCCCLGGGGGWVRCNGWCTPKLGQVTNAISDCACTGWPLSCWCIVLRWWTLGGPLPVHRDQYRQSSFLPRTLRDWNSLPAEIVITIIIIIIIILLYLYSDY